MKTKFLSVGTNPLKDSLGRLSVNEIRVLVQNLPPPISIWGNGKETYRVYLIKPPHNPKWIDDTLYELLLSMRGSYYIYGDRPPLDEFDAKSAIYAVQVDYPYRQESDSPIIEEWLSIRLVPSTNLPLGATELDFFRYRGVRIADIVQETLCRPGEHYTEIFPGCSRMCGIEPYFVRKQDEKLGISLSPRHAHSAVCYALMSLHMLDDYLKNTPARYITGVIINRFVESTLTVQIGNQKYPIAFTPASQILSIDNPQLIKLDRRSRELYAYHYPAYFFSAYHLLSFLKQTLDEGKISQVTLNCYLGEDFDLETTLKEKGMILVERLKYLSRLLTVQGEVVGSKLTGEEIRNLVDEGVPDGPELKITSLEELKKSVEAMLHITQVVRLA